VASYAERLTKIRLVVAEILGSDMPIFAVSSNKVQLLPSLSLGYWTECHQNCTRCREIRIAILQSIFERQCHKWDLSAKKRQFLTLIGCHGNVPWESKKAQCCEQALSPIYQFWNFGEDRSIRFWATGVRMSTIKIKWRKNKEKTSAKYTALLASLPSGLNKYFACI